MLTRILNSRSSSISSAAFLLVVTALLSRILGLARDRILATTFGAGDALDIYFAAFRIPDLVYNIVIAGAVSSAFIPVFMSTYSRDKNAAWRLVSNFLNVAVFSLVILAVALSILAPIIMPLVTPGFSGEKMDAAILATRIMFLSPILLGLSAILSGVSQSFKRFMGYSLAPIFYNLGIIFGALYLTKSFGVNGLAWGVVAGSLLHFLIQLPSSFFSGFSWKAVLDLRDKSLAKIGVLLVPRAIGLVAFQINLWITTSIASTLAAGSIAVFHLANNLQYIPIGIFGISFATAVFPSLSESVSVKDKGGFMRELTKVVRLVFFIVLPLSVMIFVLRAHVVRIVLGAGAFGWLDTRLTAATLGIFCVGIFAHSLIPVLSRAFYAGEDTKTPFFINILGMAINVALSFVFVFLAFDSPLFSGIVKNFLDLENVDNIELLGLPMAFSLAGVANFSILFYALAKKYPDTSFLASIHSAVIKISFAGLAAGLIAYGALFAAEPFLDTATFIGVFIQAGFAALLGTVVYLFLMFTLKSDELNSLLKILKKRMRVHSWNTKL